MSAPAEAREQLTRSRTIPAEPAAIFAVLTDPARHPDLQPGEDYGSDRRPPTVVSPATDTRITAAGDVFVMNMYIPRWDRHYVVHNAVQVFEPDRAIEWWPGGPNDAGDHEAGGWWWRYDLEPAADGTVVTMTYDWTGASQEFRDMVGGLPVFGPEYLDDCLAALERTTLS